MMELGYKDKSDDSRLLIDLSKANLKVMLLHNCNALSRTAMPIDMQ